MFEPSIKILIVDDMLTMRKIVAKALKEIGFSDITEAKDGEDAWYKLETAEKPFDLVISDWNMPNCQGIDLLKRVRAHSKLSKTPFVLVTAESELSQVTEGLSAGANQYVIKPFDRQVIEEKLKDVYTKLKKPSSNQ